MKERILGLLALCCGFLGTSLTNPKNFSNSNAGSKTVEFICANQGWVNGKQYKDFDIDEKIEAHGGGGDNACKYYTTGSAIRLYGTKEVNDYIELSSESTYITAITLTLDADQVGKLTVSCGSGSYSGATYNWTGYSDAIKFTNTATSGHTRIQKFTVTYGIADPTISLSNATPVGGYYKDGSTKKQFVSFGATVSGDDLSVISKYGINVYNDSSCSTSSLVASKSITIGEGGHTIKELTDKGGRFYTILSSDDGIEDKTKYYAKAYVKESSGAFSESETVMSAEASTSGTEYIL